jgi:type VI secretion system secreted protein VgrG
MLPKTITKRHCLQSDAAIATQTKRAVQLTSSLGDDVLLFSSMHAVERISSPFQFDVSMQSLDGALAVDDILGKEMSISYHAPNGVKRHFHGIVTEFAQADFKGEGLHQYRAQLRPWFWLLTCSADCRIFEGDTIPQIFEKLAEQHGCKDALELRLSGDFKPREYCVQYRETDFNFLSRLLEQEGIYYFFEHDAAKHTMVLADDPSAHTTRPGYKEVPYYPMSDNPGFRKRDHLTAWSFSKAMQPVAYATTDYDFKNPRKSLRSTSTIKREHARAEKLEIFDYPAELAAFEHEESERIARVRIEELQSRYMTARGHGDAVSLASGHRFKLAEHPRDDLNIDYLIIATECSLTSNDYASGSGDIPTEFAVAVEAVDAAVNYRAPRSTPKPLVHGSQTATVVGPEGEEIATDDYGRVKVKFHWDRDPNTSSCWVRVSQMWAGSNWGWMSIPRIGHEVIVDFLEGDPDQPLITGRVYNQDNMPPYGLPSASAVSGLKSQTHKGSGYNEVSMDDTAGKERITIHAQHDMSTTVLHDQTSEIKNNRTAHVVANDTLSVDANRSMTVKGKLTETIDSGQEVTVTSGYKETIVGGSTREITGPYDTTVTGPVTHTSTASTDIHCAAPGSYTSAAQLTLAVGKTSIVITPSSITITAAGSTVTVGSTGVAINGAKISLNG